MARREREPTGLEAAGDAWVPDGIQQECVLDRSALEGMWSVAVWSRDDAVFVAAAAAVVSAAETERQESEIVPWPSLLSGRSAKDGNSP